MTYTILVIESVKRSLLKAVKKLSLDHPELGEPKLVLLTAHPSRYDSFISTVDVIETDYSPASLKVIFDNIGDDVRAVICRGDKYVQYLRMTLPYLPASVPVASDLSLTATTNKRLMRQAFAASYPEITPGYMHVHDASPQSVEGVVQTLTFPVIVKPASLASSLLIQKCRNVQELAANLRTTFADLSAIYEKEERTEPPEVIVEEFMVGDFYSIDSYVRKRDEIDHCPPIRYIPADTLGIDDFFLYKRSVPTELSERDAAEAYEAATKAIRAVGLTHSAAHIELVKTKTGWKIIELGPRLGRFRNIMYREAYGIDHGYNDMLIHLGLAPRIGSDTQKYCAAYSFYPHEEGALEAIAHLDELRALNSVCYLKTAAAKGEYIRRAKDGGHAVGEVIIATSNKEVFDADCAWIESNVAVVIRKDGV